MVSNTLRPILVALLMVGLFAIAIITGGGILLQQNEATQTLTDDTEYANLLGNLTAELEDNENTMRGVETSFENSSITLTSGIPFIDSIYKSWKVMKKTPVIIYSLITGIIFQKLLGSTATAIILSVMATILIITIIIAIIKLISTGEGG